MASSIAVGGDTISSFPARSVSGPDGTMADGVEAQAEQAWQQRPQRRREAAGFAREAPDPRATTYVTVPGQVAVCRAVRDRMRLRVTAAPTLILRSSGLAAPGWLVEIEAEAVKE